jgi:nucleotide-binding universal stress UspA family protein
MRTYSKRPAPARRVLVAVDGSAVSSAALTWAAHEAASRQAGLRIVHACSSLPVWDPAATAHWAPEQHRLREHSLHILGSAEEFVRTLVPDLDVRTVLRTGSPTRVIRSEGRRASLTVLGRGPVHSRSVTSRVIARASSPVSVVGSLDPSGPCPSVSRVVAVLLPGQGTSTVLAVLDTALTTARRRRWPLTVVADWADVWQADPTGAILRVRARMTGNVDLETRSLTGPASRLLPVDCLSAAMVVLAPTHRSRAVTGSRDVFDQLLSAGGSTTFIPRA